MKSLRRPRKGGSNSNMSKSIKPCRFAIPHFTTGDLLRFSFLPKNFGSQTGIQRTFYEDQDLIVLVKPAGLVVHPSPMIQGQWLIFCWSLHWSFRNRRSHDQNCPSSGQGYFRSHGCSKKRQDHQHLATQFKEHSVKRSIGCLVKQKKEPLMPWGEDIR